MALEQWPELEVNDIAPTLVISKLNVACKGP